MKRIALLLCAVTALWSKGDLMCWVPSWSTVGSQTKYLTLLDTMDYSLFSHVVYSFATPDGKGGLYTPIDTAILRKIEQRGHEAGAKVILAFGGGASASFDPDSAFFNMTEDEMSSYIDTLMYYVKAFKLDGLDNDWEPYWETRSTRRAPYEKLMKRLRDSLPGKILMADIYLNPGSCSHLSDSSLKMMDNVNLMTYEDNFGPGFVSSIGTALDQWDSKGVDLKKIALILPFWGAKPKTWGPNYLYSDIIRRFPNAANQDSVTIDGAQVWFGSKRIMHELTVMAGERCGGVGFWHVGLDAPGEHSLITVLRNTTDSVKSGTSVMPVKPHLSAPAVSWTAGKIAVHTEADDAGIISIYTHAGKKLFSQEVRLNQGFAELPIKQNTLPRGALIAEFSAKSGSAYTRFIH